MDVLGYKPQFGFDGYLNSLRSGATENYYPPQGLPWWGIWLHVWARHAWGAALALAAWAFMASRSAVVLATLSRMYKGMA